MLLDHGLHDLLHQLRGQLVKSAIHDVLDARMQRLTPLGRIGNATGEAGPEILGVDDAEEVFPQLAAKYILNL